MENDSSSLRGTIIGFVLIVVVSIAAMLLAAITIFSSGGVTIDATDPKASHAIEFSNPLPLGPTDIALSEWAALVALTAVSLALINVVGILLALIYARIANTTATVKDADAFKTSTTSLQTKQKAVFSDFKKKAPPDPIPDHEQAEASWTKTAAALIIGLLFAPLLGAAFSENFASGDQMFNYAAGFGLVGFFGSWFALKFSGGSSTDSNQQAQSFDLSTIYIFLTGLLVVGLGLAVMMWVRGVS